MKQTILNREFKLSADGWYQIETPGEHANDEAGVSQVIDNASVASIVNRFNKDADDYEHRTGKPFPGMLIDHEHFKHQTDKESVAYGWLMRLENRNGVPFGQINWTNTGKPAVEGGDYRFFSTEYDPKDLQILNNASKPPRVRPMRLAGLSLTNNPNNKGGAPITNRATGISELKQMVKEGKGELFPTPALDKWLAAVAAIKIKAQEHGHAIIDFNTAWEWARQQFPKLYTDAFGAAEQADEADAATASKQTSVLANRIAHAARRDLIYGLDFIRENLPVIFNRTNPRSGAILNRQPELQNPQVIQEKAARLFNRLVTVEQASSKVPPACAWQNVVRDNSALAGLADGSLTFEEAVAREPELKSRLS